MCKVLYGNLTDWHSTSSDWVCEMVDGSTEPADVNLYSKIWYGPGFAGIIGTASADGVYGPRCDN